jgi:hypothetical protein
MASHTDTRALSESYSDRLSLIFTVLNAGVLGGVMIGWPRIQMSTWAPVILLATATFWLTQSRVSDYFSFGGASRTPARSLWYVWAAFLAISLTRQFAENLEFQRENSEVSNVFTSLDISLKNVTLFITLANILVWNRRQTYSERMVSLLLGIGTYALANLALDFVKPNEGMEVFGESRIEGKETRWVPPLARSNSTFAYMCACVVSAGLGWGVCNLRARKISTRGWFLGILVGVGAVLPAAMAAYKTEFRSNAGAVLLAIGLAAVPFIRRRSLALNALLTFMLIFPLLFFSSLGYAVLRSLSPEKLTMAAGARSEEDATLSSRTYLWEYAGRRLASDTGVLLIGEGPVMRDATPGFYGNWIVGYRMNFHTACIEFLMANGLILSLVAVGCVYRMLFLLYRRSGPPALWGINIDGFDPCILYMTASFVISFVDPGIAPFEGFILLMLPGFGLLLEQDRRRVRSLAVAVPVRRTQPRPARPSHGSEPLAVPAG